MSSLKACREAVTYTDTISYYQVFLTSSQTTYILHEIAWVQESLTTEICDD